MIQLLMGMDALTADFDIDKWVQKALAKGTHERLVQMGIMKRTAFNKANERLGKSAAMQALRDRKPTNKAALRAWAEEKHKLIVDFVSNTRWTLLGDEATASVGSKEATRLRLATWVYWRSMRPINNKHSKERKEKQEKEAKEAKEAEEAKDAEEAAPKYKGKGKETA
jgi:hypothetical protein